MSLPMTEGEGSIKQIMQAMLDKHLPYIDEAGKKGVQILCLQEIFNTPYFCPGQDRKWYASAEACPGPTVELMQEYAKKYNMVIIVPIYEREQAGFLYNTAAVIDADLPVSLPLNFTFLTLMTECMLKYFLWGLTAPFSLSPGCPPTIKIFPFAPGSPPLL